mmetsp:Transcript_395/g.819  ORF Transcript_395/g.819 Transcript_395/m.819 type:complete len:213 (+) Transcript_395:4212-4850(+)
MQRRIQIILKLTIDPRILRQTNPHRLRIPLLHRALEIQLGILRIDSDARTLHRDRCPDRQAILMDVPLLLNPIRGNELAPSPINGLRTHLERLIGVSLGISQTRSVGMFQRQYVTDGLVPPEGKFFGIGHLEEEGEVMIGRASVAVDVDDETPFVSVGVDGGVGVFGFFASRVAFLGVGGYGVGEFAGGCVGLGRPGGRWGGVGREGGGRGR